MMEEPVAEQVPWLAKGGEKRVAVRDMFAKIAPRYDLMNSILSIRGHHRWRKLAVDCLELSPESEVLDLCCGTGDFIPVLRKRIGAKPLVVGADFCAPMLSVARKKMGSKCSLLGSDACQLPLATESFDAVTVGWGIRNVPDVDLAHREIFRVLRIGGGFASIDMAKPKSKLLRIGSKVIFHKITPLIGSIFGAKEAYSYLPKSTATFLTREQLCRSMESAGFSDVQYRDLFGGQICIHWGHKR